MALHIKKTLRASEQKREDIEKARKEWLLWAETCDPDSLVFLDESSAKTNMCPLRGRSPKGERCFASVSGSWQTTTMLSSVRLDGTTECMVFDGSVNKAIFSIYMENLLLPALNPGDTVIMDNLSSHKNSFDEKMFKAKNITIKYLPPYSPDFNPIEKMWSKIKTLIREKAASTKEALFKAIQDAFNEISAQNVEGWFKSCGYYH